MQTAVRQNSMGGPPTGGTVLNAEKNRQLHENLGVCDIMSGKQRCSPRQPTQRRFCLSKISPIIMKVSQMTGDWHRRKNP
jgi:hypothetical protein